MQELLKSLIGSCAGSAEHPNWYQCGKVQGKGSFAFETTAHSRNDYIPGFPNPSMTAFPAG